MLVSAVGVVLVVAAGVVAWRMTRDGEVTAETDRGTWNEVVLVDRANGAVVSVDEQGAAQASLPATSRTTAVHVEGDRVALVESSQIVLTDLSSAAPDVITIEADSAVTRLPIAGALWLAVIKPSGGNALLVDGVSATTYDIGALAELTQPRFYIDTLQFDAGGEVFAIADATDFQTVVVDTSADPPAVSFFAAQPLAVDSEHVVTSQVIGQQAEIRLFDADNTPRATVYDELPAGGSLDGDEVVTASINGAISRFGPEDDTAERVGIVAVPAGEAISSLHPTADGSRWVAFGSVFEAVVDLDGRTVFTTVFATPADEPAIEPDWTCLPVGGGQIFHSIVGLTDGEQIADLTGLVVTGVSADGCTVVGTRAGAFEVVGTGGSAQLGRLRSAALAPDGAAVVVQTTTGQTQLISIDDEWSLGEPIDLTADTPANVIVSFRQV